jgi:hypothetical protein
MGNCASCNTVDVENTDPPEKLVVSPLHQSQLSIESGASDQSYVADRKISQSSSLDEELDDLDHGDLRMNVESTHRELNNTLSDIKSLINSPRVELLPSPPKTAPPPRMNSTPRNLTTFEADDGLVPLKRMDSRGNRVATLSKEEGEVIVAPEVIASIRESPESVTVALVTPLVTPPAPVSEPVVVVESAPEPVVVVESAPEPVVVIESAPEPVVVVESAPEPVVVVESAPEPVVVESAPGPVVVIESAPEPVAVALAESAPESSASLSSVPNAPAPVIEEHSFQWTQLAEGLLSIFKNNMTSLHTSPLSSTGASMSMLESEAMIRAIAAATPTSPSADPASSLSVEERAIQSILGTLKRAKSVAGLKEDAPVNSVVLASFLAALSFEIEADKETLSKLSGQ